MALLRPSQSHGLSEATFILAIRCHAKPHASDLPTLRTRRLDLVPPHHSHLATYETLYGSPEVMRHIAEPIDKQAAASLLAAHAGSWVLYGFGSWCVEQRATQAVIGIAGLKRPEQGERVEVGWIIEPSAWGLRP